MKLYNLNPYQIRQISSSIIISLLFSCLINAQTNLKTSDKSKNINEKEIVRKVYPIVTNENGQVLIEAEKLNDFTNNYAVIGINSARGFFLRRDGAVLKELPIDFRFDQDLFVNKYNIVIDNDNQLFNIAIGSAIPLIRVKSRKNGYYFSESSDPNIDTLGYTIQYKTYKFYDEKGKLVLNRTFQSMNCLGEEMFSYSLPTGYYSSNCGLMNVNGKKVTEALYYFIGDFSEGLAKISIYENMEKRWGYINKEGKIKIEPKYSNEPTDFHCRRAFVKSKDGRYSLIDMEGNHLTEDVFYKVSDFCNGKALVLANKEHFSKQIIDTTGKILVDFGTKYSLIEPCNDCLILVRENRYDGVRSVGYLDYDGNIVIDLIFEELSNFNNGLAIARLKDSDDKIKYGYINKSGKFEILVKEESKY